MMLRFVILLLALSGGMAGSPVRAQELSVTGRHYRATIADGQLERLVDGAGRTLIRPPDDGTPVSLHLIDRQSGGVAQSGQQQIAAGQQATCRYGPFAGLTAATAQGSYSVQADSDDLVIEQQAAAKSPGLWGLSWSTGTIPPEYAIIVPGRSGLRLSARSPGNIHTYDYPQGWEAQMVIVEGPGHGFWIWADDGQGRYKRLVVRRNAAGWQLQLITLNDAPFDALTQCRSVAWHVNVYEGDWRVPARRYRQWMDEHFRPTPLEKQHPAWVRETRACVIMPLTLDLLEALPRRFDPPQTLLYVPSWRTAGYDRNYPEYDRVPPELEPFLKRSRALGFRVMLHVNYFGVDPLHPLYAQFKRYQVRSPWGKHERQWWLWERATPTIRFAYINPAAKAWRELFVSRMVEICHRWPVDALHLDQTLCIENDNNGRIDGLSMLEGNLALHRELRAALPEVALSGEGLNEVTYRYEAFAQRHAWGLNHAEGTWSRPELQCAHPISSYLFLPATIMYGYLGYTAPSHDQLYAAWNEAYQHWGVIPTWRPGGESLDHPQGFARQLFDEVTFWQREKPRPAMDGPWPATVAFPLRTAGGQAAQRTNDGRLLCGPRQISWTIRDANQVRTPWKIPLWMAYDPQRLLGLDPDRSYAAFDEPRDPRAFHLAEVPPDVTAAEVFRTPQIALVGLRPVQRIVADLIVDLERATCGSRPFDAPAVEVVGPLHSADGAMFAPAGDRIVAHPPYQAKVIDAQTGRTRTGSGVAFARYHLALPTGNHVRMLSDIYLEKGAMQPGRSDGVLFAVTARAAGQKVHGEQFCTSETPQPLEVDLTDLAGRTIDLELSVDPGPRRSASFDWARWLRPRIESSAKLEGRLAIVDPTPWKLALGPQGPMRLKEEGERHLLQGALSAALYLLSETPPSVTATVDLLTQPRVVVGLSDTGQMLDKLPAGGVHPDTVSVGGVKREALSAHPPDHGRTLVLLPMTLPREPLTLQTSVGIRDGSTSTGVIFIASVNGRELARQRMLPGKWAELSADVTPWAGQPVVISLVTDSDGPFYFDWAHWGQPRLVERR